VVALDLTIVVQSQNLVVQVLVLVEMLEVLEMVTEK
jgi:hypothetical protein